ncbi:MAG: hypothetical protein LKM44_01800 [Wolbachia endosymbiont of Meromenopon meropis]|nr:hypothetical protein [Wolbachia endosymbiont of Meromenopon meropis]
MISFDSDEAKKNKEFEVKVLNFIMIHRKRKLILLTRVIIMIVIILAIFLLKIYRHLHEDDIVHFKNESKEFKKKPENSIESTVLYREREVYDYIFRSND